MHQQISTFAVRLLCFLSFLDYVLVRSVAWILEMLSDSFNTCSQLIYIC